MYLLKRFEVGDVLFRQGDPSDHVVLIRSGSVDVVREIGADSSGSAPPMRASFWARWAYSRGDHAARR